MTDHSTGPANGHTTGDEREVFMEFVNFDGRLTRQTARDVIKLAKQAGMPVHELLTYALQAGLDSYGIGDTSDTKVEPMAINAGNGGFHLMTFVADGYGNLVAEDSNGKELARTEWQDVEEGGTHDEFRQLADRVFAEQERQG